MYKLLDVVIWSISQSFGSVKRRECCFEVFSVEKSICLSNKRGCKGWVANFSNLRGKSCLFLLHGSSLNASQTNSTGLDTAILLIVRHSSPRHSSPRTFITSDIHHPLPKIRHSSPRTFITSDIHHLRHSSPRTFITSDIHHPLPKIRRSSPQTFIT